MFATERSATVEVPRDDVAAVNEEVANKEPKVAVGAESEESIRFEIVVVASVDVPVTVRIPSDVIEVVASISPE